MTLARTLYALGVLAACVCLFLSPWPFLGFLPACPGLIWAAYDLTEVKGADSPRAPRDD